MNRIRSKQKSFLERNKQAEQKAFLRVWTVVGVVALFGILITLIYPQKLNFEDCASENPQNCGCQLNTASLNISKNIVFIDATDPIPASKKQDTIEILKGFTEPSSFLYSALGRYVRTSVFVFSNQKSDELSPIASFCQLPHEAILSLRHSQSEIEKFKNKILKVATDASNVAQANQFGAASTLVQAISVSSGSGAYWNKQGKFVFISDLIERSSECGYFDKTAPNFAKNSKACNQFVDRASESMKGSQAYVCLIQRSNQPLLLGVSPWWQEYFQTVSGNPAYLTCDPARINN